MLHECCGPHFSYVLCAQERLMNPWVHCRMIGATATCHPPASLALQAEGHPALRTQLLTISLSLLCSPAVSLLLALQPVVLNVVHGLQHEHAAMEMESPRWHGNQRL